VATALAVGVGGVVLHGSGLGGSASTGVLAGAASDGSSTGKQLGKARAAALVGSAHGSRADRRAAVSRSGVRNPVRADPQHLQTLDKKAAKPFKVVHAGPPIRRIPKPAPSDPFTFRMGTFNILGSQHTRGSKRWGPGTTRAGFTSSLIQGYGLDLIGMQEVQDDQLNVLNARLAGYTVWPSRALGNNGVRLQIAFRDSMFELVEAHSFTTVFDHQYRPIPVVLLRNRVTGGEFYYMTFHNSPLGMVAERAAAKRAEIAHINGLLATGRPVIISGDMNEKAPFFCQVGAATGMVAANGGSPSGCILPPPPVKIDWIMGGGGVSFSGYTLGVGGLVARASDHEFPHTTVTVTP
jgi:endonuclease/exonuclease/phosphatase family metal-dependent hydrolase